MNKTDFTFLQSVFVPGFKQQCESWICYVTSFKPWFPYQQYGDHILPTHRVIVRIK